MISNKALEDFNGDDLTDEHKLLLSSFLVWLNEEVDCPHNEELPTQSNNLICCICGDTTLTKRKISRCQLYEEEVRE